MSEAQKSAGTDSPPWDDRGAQISFPNYSHDLTGPYNLTPRGNKYLLTFVDRFTRYAETYPISSQSAEECAHIYAAHVVTRHGTGSKLITDQGRNFMSSFFQETCKILGIQKIHTTSWHPQSNGCAERFHRHYTQGCHIL